MYNLNRINIEFLVFMNNHDMTWERAPEKTLV